MSSRGAAGIMQAPKEGAPVAIVSVDEELVEKARLAWGYATYEETVEEALKGYIKKLKMDEQTRRSLEKWRREEDERLRRLRRGDT